MGNPTSTARRLGGARRRLALVPFPVALLALATIATAPAANAGAAKRVAIMPDADAADAPVRAQIGKAIGKALKQHKMQAVAPAQVKKALKKSGVPASDEDWVNLARKLKVEAFVTATASKNGAKKGAKRRVEIVVRSGADGGTAGQETFTAKGPPKRLGAAVAAGFWKKLGRAFKKTGPPPKAEGGAGLAARDLPPPEEPGLGANKTETESQPAKPAASADRDQKPTGSKDDAPDVSKGGGGENAAASEKHDHGSDNDDGRDNDDDKNVSAGGGAHARAPRPVEVELDLRFMRRLFAYVPVSAARYYYLNFVPLVGASASWFPIPYAGVFAHGEFTNLLKTGIYPTATREIVVGAQGRLPISIGQLGASVAFFQHLFVITDTAAANDTPRTSLPTPDTTYTGARIAVGGRARLGDRVLVGLEGAYRLVTNPGQGAHLVRSPDYFPNATVSVGIDGAAFVGIGILDFLEVRAGADYRRYVFGPLQGANINATAATDDYLAFSLGLMGAFGGN